MIKKLFTHTFIYTLAPQAPRLASLLLMPIITKYLSATDYGIYGIITSYLFFVTVVKDLGLGVVFVNTFYKHPKKWKLIWRMLHGHLIFWGLFYSALLLIILKLIIPAQASYNFWWIALLVLVPALLFDNSNTIGSYYFRFSQRPAFIGIVSASTGVISVVTTYLCIVVFKLGYMAWFIAAFVASFTSFIFYLYPLYFKLKLYPILSIRKKFILHHFKVALPMIPHNYSSYLLNSSDRVILDQYRVNVSQIGQYNIAYTFGNYFESVGEAVGMAVGPFYSKLYSSEKKEAQEHVRNLTFFLMGAFTTSTFMVSLWLKEIFLFMLRNKELQSAYGIGIIIIMSYAYRPMYWSAGIKLSMNEKTSILWRISFVAGILNVILNLIFIPYYGIYAAAGSTLIALIYMGFSGYYFKAYKKMKGLNHYPEYWLITIILLAFLAYVLKDVFIPIKLGISFGVLALCLLAIFKYTHLLKEIEV